MTALGPAGSAPDPALAAPDPARTAPDPALAAPPRRWLVLLVAALVAAGCVTAGIWQWERHQARAAAVAAIAANYDAPPVPLEQVGLPLPSDQAWRPVRVSGEYLPATVLLRNRPIAGQPVLQVLGLLRIDTGPHQGRILVTNRGWVPAGDPVPESPPGRVQVVARLRPTEAPSDRQAPAGQVYAIAAAQVAAAAGVTAEPLPAYGVVASENGVAPAHPIPEPDQGLGPHLSYAFQWWFFAVGAPVGAFVLVRRGEPTARRRTTDEEVEDALVDAARGS